MIHLKILMFSYIELAELHVWVDKEVQLFSYYQRLVIALYTALFSLFLHLVVFSIYEVLIGFRLSQEEAYVEFLRIRRVPLQERICPDDVSDVVLQVSIMYVTFTFFYNGKFIYIIYYSFAPVSKASLCPLNVN